MSRSSSKNKWWTYLWLRSEVPLILFILFNLGASALTGWYTPRLVTDFYQSLKNSVIGISKESARTLIVVRVVLISPLSILPTWLIGISAE